MSRTPAEAELFGRKPAAPPAELWREAADAVEVVVRLWDSWEDDAVIRDVATGRYVDRDKLHYIDFAGEFFSVKGPSITPRSPQAHPLVVLRGDEARGSSRSPPRWADVVRVAAADLAAAHTARDRVRAAVAAAGRDPDDVAVLLDVEVLLGCGRGGRPPRARRARRPPRASIRAPSLRVVDTADALVDVIAEAVSAVLPTASPPCPWRCPAACRPSPPTWCPGSPTAACDRRSRPGRRCASASACPAPANRFAGVNA